MSRSAARGDLVLLGLEFVESSDRPCSRKMNAAQERALYTMINRYVHDHWDGKEQYVGPIEVDGWHVIVRVNERGHTDGLHYVSYTAFCSDADPPEAGNPIKLAG